MAGEKGSDPGYSSSETVDEQIDLTNNGLHAESDQATDDNVSYVLNLMSSTIYTFRGPYGLKTFLSVFYTQKVRLEHHFSRNLCTSWDY